MIRQIASRSHFRVSMPLAAGAALIVAAIGVPLNASAESHSGTATAAVARTLVQGVHKLSAREGDAAGSHAVGSHQSLVPCTFNGVSTLVVSDVTPGEPINVSCTGFLPNANVAMGEASPLSVALDETQGVNEIDVTDTKVVAADSSGNLTTTFDVPNPFSAPDPAATCPPSQIQVNSGLPACLFVLVDTDGNVGGAAFLYAGQANPEPAGYQEVASDGGTFSFDTPFYGSEGGVHLVKPIVGVAFDPDTGGYWEVASDGGIFAFNAPFYGSMGGKPLVKPIVGMAFDPDSGGYWEVASDGGVFAFNAPFEGSEGGTALVKPIVGITADPLTGGYWEVASDGGLFAFNAPFQGSEGGAPLVKPVVGMAFDSDTGGYWEVASDGGVFSFGGAPFQGSEGGAPLVKPIVGIADDPLTGGYWEVASDGGLFAFNAPFQGSEGGKALVKPIVGMAPAVLE
ncbi:MAG TPA: hypothetical protein VIJ09_12955 [Acidimicrobiales bacterium]|jgi:hypothetical protein